MQSAAGTSITGLNDLMGALSTAQSTYHQGTDAAVPLTVREVIAANDPQASLSTSATNLGFAAVFEANRIAFTRTYEGKTDLKRFADVSHRSLDVFSGSDDTLDMQRAGPIRLPIAFRDSGARDIPLPWIGGGVMWFSIDHTGGTELTSDFRSWNALDVSSMSGQSHWFNGCSHWYTLGMPTCWNNNFFVEIPIAWDGAYAGRSRPSDKSFINSNYKRGISSYGQSLGLNSASTAAALVAKPSSIGTFSGLRPYQDVSNIKQDRTNAMKNVDATLSGSSIPSVVIEVEKAAAAVPTTANMTGGPNGDVAIGTSKAALRLNDGEAGKVMRVVAGAEVYFARPATPGQAAVEWPSLFNPYWQARLRDTHAQAVLSAANQ